MTGTYTGQFVMNGFLDLKVRAGPRRGQEQRGGAADGLPCGAPAPAHLCPGAAGGAALRFL